jgi:hypothetical protein
MDFRKTFASTPKKFDKRRYLKLALEQDKPLNHLSRHTGRKYHITRKRFKDLKSIMNGLLYPAAENKIIKQNCLRDITY